MRIIFIAILLAALLLAAWLIYNGLNELEPIEPVKVHLKKGQNTDDLTPWLFPYRQEQPWRPTSRPGWETTRPWPLENL